MRASVILLAGGRATRLPGKLALPIEGVPLLVRAYRNLASDEREIVLSLGATGFDPALKALLPIPFVVDRYEGRGPLGGLISVMEGLEAERVFAIAGDMPRIDAAFLERMEAGWHPGDEALVPAYESTTGRRLEPLAALYDRRGFLREGHRVLHDGGGAMHAVIAALRTRYTQSEPPQLFANLNTLADVAALEAQERQTA
jgi:molybdopterin-guanine dinucleotide biosynthesis protein A